VSAPTARDAECPAVWVDDWGKPHECFDDNDHLGQHECSCGATVPRRLLDLAARLAAAVAFVASVDRPLKTHAAGDGVDEREALRTLTADARRAGLLPADGGEGR
jgi:hypothetical protein